jgi:phosphate transport system permease protein
MTPTAGPESGAKTTLRTTDKSARPGFFRKSGLRRRLTELGIRSLLFIAAALSIVIIFFIILFLFREAIPAFSEIGVFKLLSGDYWNPSGIPPSYGAWPLIVGTLLVTLGAMAFAIPVGIGSAIFIACLAPPKLRLALKSLSEILSGIPSVVYGVFGLLVLTNWIRITFERPTGETWLAASLILGIMALPIIISVAEDAISSVPKEYIEASLSVGATRWQTIRRVIVPSAISGITAAVILGMGRAVGETMAVLMVAGNSAIIPSPIMNVFSPVRTLTATLGIEMGEVARGSTWYSTLFALAVILFVITLVINTMANYILARLKEKFKPGARRKKPAAWRQRLRASAFRLIGEDGTKKFELPPAARTWLGRAGMAFLVLAVLWLLVSWFGWLWGPVTLAVLALLYVGYGKLAEKNRQRAAFALITAAAVTMLFLLGVILYFIISNGLPAMSWEFLSQSPSNLGRKGGIYPAIVGTLILVGGTLAIAVPLGVGAGIYLSEYAKEGKLTKVIRAAIDNLNGTPSIVFGLFGLAFLVLYLDMGVSMLAGWLTLAFMILPTVIRTTEEALQTVPVPIREGSLALGATKWQTIRKIVLPNGASGVITGVVLGAGRAAGETAPILFTAAVAFTRFLPDNIYDPVMALPYHLFILTTSIPGSRTQAYGTALVLLLIVLPMYALSAYLRFRINKKKR